MRDLDKPKEQLIDELAELRLRNTELEALGAEYRRAEEELRKHRDHHEELAPERTEELTRTVEQLRNEITERRRVEEQLSILSSVVEQSANSIAILDREGKAEYVNPKLLELYGLSPEDVIGKHWQSFLSMQSSLRESYAEIWDTVMKEGMLWRGEVTDRAKTGEQVWRDAAIFPIRDAESGFTHFVYTSQDITERKSAEEALRQNEARLRSLIQAAPSVILCLSPDGQVIEFNPEAERLYGQKREDALGQNYLELFLPEEVREQVADDIRKVLAGEPTRGYENPVKAADGSERLLIWNVNPLHDEQGQPLGIVAAGQDITERKQAEKALRESEEKYRNLFHHSNDGIIIHDPGGNIIDVNQKALDQFGYARSEMLLARIPDLHPSGAFEASKRAFEAIIREGSVSFEIDFKKKNGEVFCAEVSSSLFVFQEEKAVQGIVRDITERKQAEEELQKHRQHLEELVKERTEQLEQELAERKRAELAKQRANTQLEAANRELEAFAYSVSHDLRAPLRAIDGFSRVLLEDYADKLDDDAKHYLERVHAGTQRMGQLIDDLLKLSHATRKEMKQETVNLSNMATDTIQAFQQLGTERQVEVIIQEGVVVQGDAYLLHAVMENLLENAWKFTSKRSQAKIEFGVEEREGKPVYFVRDNGVGFDMTYVDKLFVPFQRLHSSDEFPGTGIGLANVRRIVRRHGGRVWAQGEAGKGARFCFTLQQN